MGTAVMNLLVQMQSALADYRDNWVAPCVEFDGGDPDQLASIEALIAEVEKVAQNETAKIDLVIHLADGKVNDITLRNADEALFGSVIVLDSDVLDKQAGDVCVSDGVHCILSRPSLCRDDSFTMPEVNDAGLSLEIENVIGGLRNYGYRVTAKPLPGHNQEYYENLRDGLRLLERNIECYRRHYGVRGTNTKRIRRMLWRDFPEPCWGVSAPTMRR